MPVQGERWNLSRPQQLIVYHHSEEDKTRDTDDVWDWLTTIVTRLAIIRRKPGCWLMLWVEKKEWIYQLYQEIGTRIRDWSPYFRIAAQVMDLITFQPELSKRIRRCREEVMSHEKESLVEKRIKGQKDDKEILIFSSSI